MCGIAGMAGPAADGAICRKMVDCISHRGPDGRGFYNDAGVSMGHARLSIIDLETGDQPMSNEDGSVWIAFNGEIYNFKKLKDALKAQGHVFKTTSDTEVILHGYEQNGPDFIQQLDGIFAFSLWDKNKKRLLLARDYFGVKPLHFHYDGKNIRFGSELKSILVDPGVDRRVDHQSLHHFMNLRYIPGTGTLIKGIQRLEPAHFILFEKQRIIKKRYYTFRPVDHGPKKEDDYLEGLRFYLENAVKKQMISDTPLGVYLSGGMDSSAIAAFMTRHASEKVETFCLGFNEPTDELDDARAIAGAFGTDHHETTIEASPLKSYPEVIWHVEEPKENILQGYLLAKFASRYVKVVQGGLGGDEIFAGYAVNRFIYPVSHLHAAVPAAFNKTILSSASRLVFRLQNGEKPAFDEYRRGLQLLLSLGDPKQYYLILRNVWDHDAAFKQRLYGPELLGQTLHPVSRAFDAWFDAPDKTALEKALWAEFHTKLVDDFLMNEDRTSMAHGLEVRVPFLDRDLASFAMGIPASVLMKGNHTKHLFRKAMKGILPDETINKKKWGFTFNPYIQFQKDLKDTALKILTKRKVEERGWFNYDYIEKIIHHPPHPRLRWHYFYLWLVLGLEIWAQMFLEGDVSHPKMEIASYCQ